MDTQRIQGLDKLAAALRQLPTNIAKRQLAKSVAPAAKLIRDDAERRAPVDTGRLQQAVLMKKTVSNLVSVTYIVTVRHGKGEQAVNKWGGTVNLDAYYWTFQEFGTSKMAAQQFIRPAFESNKAQALDVILNKLKTGIDYEATLLAWGKA